MGKKKQPVYRIVAADSHFARDGRVIEYIGRYNPRSNPREVVIDEEKALKWLSEGAQPTDTVRNLLSEKGILQKWTESKKK